jgi:hypothetical protein
LSTIPLLEEDMAYSSITGADSAPIHPSGRDAQLLGPSDNSDSGSDTVGTHEAHADSDAVGTGERGSVSAREGKEGADILPDRVVRAEDGNGLPEADPDTQEFTDLDAREPGSDAGEDSEDDAR